MARDLTRFEKQCKYITVRNQTIALCTHTHTHTKKRAVTQMHQVLFSFLLLVFFLLFCTAECRRSHQSPAYSKKTLSNASYLYAYVHRPHRPQPLTSGLPSTLLNHHRQGIDDAGRGEFSQHLRRGNLHGDFFYELVDSK